MEYNKINFDNYALFYSFNYKNNSHKFLNEILKKEYLISNYEIVTNINGKPYLKNCSLFFNISNKKDMIGIVISNEEIGLDIEYIDSLEIKNDSILKYFFTNREREYIKNNKDLLLTWTKKESYIKLLGGRLADCKDIDVFELKTKFKSIQIDDYIITICNY